MPKYIATMAVVVGTLACGESSPPPDSMLGVDHVSDEGVIPYLTPSLVTSVVRDRLPVFPPEVPSGTATISPEQAATLAVAYATQFGPYVRDDLETFHGASIDFSSLKARNDIMVVQSAYEPVDPAAFEPLRKAVGPYYLVTLQQQNVPAVVVAVSALAIDVEVVGGRIVRPIVHGNEFRLGAVAQSGHGLPIAAEEAVRIAGNVTGARVAAIPTFRSRGLRWSPRTGYWTIQLDRPVRARSAEGTRVVSQVHIGPDRIVSADPPTSVDPITIRIEASRAVPMARTYELQPKR